MFSLEFGLVRNYLNQFLMPKSVFNAELPKFYPNFTQILLSLCQKNTAPKSLYR